MKTDLNALKEISKMFLFIPIERDSELPFIVYHPYFNSSYVCLNGELIDLCADEGSYKNYLLYVENIIDSCESPKALMSILLPQYAMTWLKHSRHFLSEEDFSALLGDAWVNCENANMDKNVPISESEKWFRKAVKSKLMNAEEYEFYRSILDSIILYRGVANGRNEKGMSWTDNKEKAKWFMQRFGDNGYMLKMTAKKSDILAYFSRRGRHQMQS